MLSPREKQVKQQFEEDTSLHELSIIRDDGVYRHLRCAQPGTWCYGFDVVTWPGYLAIVGDAGDYLFSRLNDMFEFFGDGTKYSDGINPHYWAQKLQGPGMGSVLSEEYSHETFEAVMAEWVRQASLDDMEQEQLVYPGLIQEALQRERIYEYTHSETEAREIIHELQREGIIHQDTWEWDLRDYRRDFLWCCWGIIWAIGQYQKQRELVVA